MKESNFLFKYINHLEHQEVYDDVLDHFPNGRCLTLSFNQMGIAHLIV